MIKKVSAILLALMMLLSMSFVVSADTTGTIELTMDPAKVFYDTEATEDILFDVNIILKGAPSVGAFSFKLDYNKDVIVPVNAGTTTDALLTGMAVKNHFGQTGGLDNWYVASEAIGDGTFNYVGMFNSTNPLLPTASADQKFDVPADGLTCYTVTFKVKGSGATGLALTVIDNVCFTLQPADVITISSIDVSKVATINAKPVAPTATMLGASTNAPVEGGTVEPTYTWNNGLTDNGAVTDDAATDGSVVTWYAGTKKVGETVAKAAFNVPADAVGKELSYTILPKVTPVRDIAPEGTVSAKAVVGNVAAIGAYEPSVTAVTLDNGAVNDGEILASTAVTAVPTTDTTYSDDVKTYTFEYAWYAVDLRANENATAADAIDAAEAYTTDSATIEAAGTTATATFDAGEYKDWFAVVKVTPSVTIAGEANARPGDAFYAAALITGEPPVLSDLNEKLATKKIDSKDTVTVKNSDVEFESNAVGSDKSIKYTYNWYLITPLEEGETFDATGLTAVQTDENAAQTKLKLKDIEKAGTTVIGKQLVLVVKATDAIGISAEEVVVFANPITEATSSGSGTSGSTSLVTGGVVDSTPADDKTDDETEEDNSIKFENEEGDPTDGKTYSAAQFEDISAELYPWAYDYVDTLAKAAIVKGMDDTHYGPEYETTYGQYIALVVRTLGLTADNAATSKVISTHWSYSEVAVADTLGLLADFETINPDASIPREDMAVIAYKGILAAELEVAGEVAIEYSDAASISEYASEAVAEMTKIGILNGMGDGTFAPKAYTTRIQAAKVIGMLYALVG